MKGHRRLEAPRPGLHAETVDKKIAQLPRAPAERLDFAEVSFILKLQHRAMKHHRRARAGGHDDRLFARKSFHRMAHHLARRSPVATVEGRLPTARLPFGKHDLDSEVFEHLHRGRGDVVVEGIAQARSHELHTLAGNGFSLGVEHRNGKTCDAFRFLQPQIPRRRGGSATNFCTQTPAIFP